MLPPTGSACLVLYSLSVGRKDQGKHMKAMTFDKSFADGFNKI